MVEFNMLAQDELSLNEAKEAAERLSFYPLMFQAAVSLNRLGILQEVANSGKVGIDSDSIGQKVGVSQYGVETLLEAGLSLGLVMLVQPYKYRITKMGSFWLLDRQTNVNTNFVQDVCSKGALHLEEAIREEGPSGLKELGNWPTIYHGLSKLTEPTRSSWFNFDHHYSDQAFPQALKEVFSYGPTSMLDIGGNTGKWAFQCVDFNPNVHVAIVDLPGQCGLAKERIEKAGLSDRISTFEQNVLDRSYRLPSGQDAVWMSQFLDCFSPTQIMHILKHVGEAITSDGRVFILDTFWDLQDNPTATYCLHGTSLYFTVMANGNSKMYDSSRMTQYVENAGLEVEKIIRKVGHYHSLIVCKKSNRS